MQWFLRALQYFNTSCSKAKLRVNSACSCSFDKITACLCYMGKSKSGARSKQKRFLKVVHEDTFQAMS